MAMEHITSEKPATIKVGSNTTIDETHNHLVSMWVYHVNQEMWSNPVMLADFFGEYAAYVGFYANLVNMMYKTTSAAVAKEVKLVYTSNPTATATFISDLVRRTERQLTASLDYHERELKSFNSNINSMQTQLRLYGDEAKIMAGSRG
jgi:hypothetical protein